MYVTEGQIEMLKPYIANIEELIKNDDIQEVLDVIDDELDKFDDDFEDSFEDDYFVEEDL